ncbi:octanoyl-[acyl-carrier-protein]:protein N-octanoyltransferase LIPT2, mitochondrial [Euwallacea similis]|uniref:octanoyl-[acyl-carrier-protein]:protein N-octanoyltransferase LIPT2, mitochondrial n=1 Tax=Euwallacea similis TaxID=1736056 RepID=UPI00344E269E
MAINFEKLVKIWKVGKINYARGLKLQEQLSSCHNFSDSSKNVLLCLEHFPVYTIGIRTKDYGFEEEKKLKETGADFFKTNRGGLITFHGPGQLVVYPILNLKHFTPSMRWYVCQIERTIIDLCSKFGLNAETSIDTGVWIGNNKICAIGIHGSRFITTHGLAFNCNTDLAWFDNIVPCGLVGKGVTSLSKELNRDISVDEVLPKFIDSFCTSFNCGAIAITEEETNDILDKLGLNRKAECISH